MATYAEMKEIFDDIRSDFRYDHELNGCLNCGICTATCPSAHFYDYSPREIVQLLWTENVEQQIESANRDRSQAPENRAESAGRHGRLVQYARVLPRPRR